MERPSNTTLALLGGVAALVLLLIIFAATRDADQDKIGETATFSADDSDLNRACSGQGLYEQIKRALFRQAAQSRGKDGEAYERIAAVAAVRMENPAAEGQDQASGFVDCAGSLAIDLPPGVTTVAGRRQLMTDIYYSVDPAGQRRVTQLRGASGIVNELAGLTLQAGASAPRPAPPTPSIVEDDPLAAEPPEVDPYPPPAPAPPPPPQATARPSYDCRRATTSSERAVCADPGLAALDRAMAAEYSRALDVASPVELRQLRGTRDRFLLYRDRCPNDACIAAAYNDRVREIRDIMAGRWSPNR